MPDTTLPVTGFNRTVIYRIPDLTGFFATSPGLGLKRYILRPCHTRQFFLATCNANLGEKDISGSCRIVDICKLLYDLQSDYFAN